MKDAGLRWITSIAPSHDELEALERMGFPREDLLDALDPHERPRIRSRQDTTLVVLRITSVDRSQAPLTTLPLGILLQPDRGLILSTKDVELVRRLSSSFEREEPHRGIAAHRAISAVLELVATDYLKQLAAIDEAVDDIETRLEGSLANREVLALLQHQKSLLHFTVALDEMLAVVEHLQKVPSLRPASGDATWLEDVLVEFRQALDVARLSSNGLGQMMDAFASIISNDLNVVMKFLASVTVVLTWPLFLVSLFGMNVPLPGQSSPAALAVVMTTAAAGCAILVLLLRRRRWL
jgi:magnesium transporter